ncbi:hypothetical protein PTKIN_Ptkin13bG0236000 [Pterospermum kingtungense]
MVVIFSKTLSNTDVNKRCAVPMKYFKMKRFPKLQGNGKVDFAVRDENGQNHILCCSKRKIGKHPKPVLIKGWIPFSCKKKLRAGDRVVIYEEQDETGLMQRRINVEKQTSSSVVSQNFDGNKGSTTNNSDNESTATLQTLGVLSDVLNPGLGGTNSTTSSSIDEDQVPTPHSSCQYSNTTERPRLRLSLELALKPSTTWGFTAATGSSTDKEQASCPHSISQDAAYSTRIWTTTSALILLNVKY